ncbi:MAG TPA: class II fructose-bisphosphate aldolase [Firmicutes bacterium]|jgi:ketose-bisphosphate aldolase|nr:MAG: hypothetical protein AA931_06100 [Peptococcaceae bacterium 1109]HHT72241.1 class II fructose-bisphosphate aldolase [Bacillota bacterium]
MKFEPMHTLLHRAKRGGYAVPAINVFNMESIQAVVETANEEQAPIIIMAEQRDLLHAGVEFMVKMAEAALAVAEVPVAFHLDHGRDMELLKRGIGAGFSSVMFDGSQLSFEENIRLTGQVVSWAEERGVSVEAELGHVALAGAEGDGAPTDGLLTDPAMVPPFVEATGVHALAVAIGTAHGVYTSLPKLDFDRLSAIARGVDIPLVLHGGSGTPDPDLKRAIELGVCKINVGTDVRRAFVAAVVEAGKDPDLDVREVMTYAKSKMKEIIRDRIRVFGAQGRA